MMSSLEILSCYNSLRLICVGGGEGDNESWRQIDQMIRTAKNTSNESESSRSPLIIKPSSPHNTFGQGELISRTRKR